MEAALAALKADKDAMALMIRALKESHAEESRLEALYLDKLDKVIPPEFFTSKSHEWQEKLTGLRTKIDGS